MSDEVKKEVMRCAQEVKDEVNSLTLVEVKMDAGRFGSSTSTMSTMSTKSSPGGQRAKP